MKIMDRLRARKARVRVSLPGGDGKGLFEVHAYLTDEEGNRKHLLLRPVGRGFGHSCCLVLPYEGGFSTIYKGIPSAQERASIEKKLRAEGIMPIIPLEDVRLDAAPEDVLHVAQRAAEHAGGVWNFLGILITSLFVIFWGTLLLECVKAYWFS